LFIHYGTILKIRNQPVRGRPDAIGPFLVGKEGKERKKGQKEYHVDFQTGNGSSESEYTSSQISFNSKET